MSISKYMTLIITFKVMSALIRLSISDHVHDHFKIIELNHLQVMSSFSKSLLFLVREMKRQRDFIYSYVHHHFEIFDLNHDFYGFLKLTSIFLKRLLIFDIRFHMSETFHDTFFDRSKIIHLDQDLEFFRRDIIFPLKINCEIFQTSIPNHFRRLTFKCYFIS